MNISNIDEDTVVSFGHEWSKYNQSALSEKEWRLLYDRYFSIFPFSDLKSDAVGFDMGCGSGRWAKGVAPIVKQLNCIDPAPAAIEVARRTLADYDNVRFIEAEVGNVPLSPESQDFGYSLGVLHHIPNTLSALKSCTGLLKRDAPFLVYLYYSLENRNIMFRGIWRLSEIARHIISRLPNRAKSAVTDLIAAIIYWPLARAAFLLEKVGVNPSSIPLSAYRNVSFYTMRTDSRDRFGTPLEQRFTRSDIRKMMIASGLRDITFSEREPYWVALGFKA